uniref:ADP-ribosyl cyclase/cyclic ADP-ribose hydrolase n=1 Tax=Lotus japonicus TaxID=34305 RepID=I3S4A3_LOTJA|nr:unknown [Lotus japonicus]
MAGKSHNFTYDVFISLRGEVLRDTFIECFLKELMQKGIKTFIDGEIMEAGDVISPAVSKAIEESKVLIVVFCVNYASSTRCLDELYKIYSRRIGYEQHVFPIFYLIEPTVVRHQTANYAEAMTAHEERFGQSSEKVETWRLALNGICQISGHHASNRYISFFGT